MRYGEAFWRAHHEAWQQNAFCRRSSRSAAWRGMQRPRSAMWSNSRPGDQSLAALIQELQQAITSGPMTALGHVWTAPWQDLSDISAALVGSGNVSGFRTVTIPVWCTESPQRLNWPSNRAAYLPFSLASLPVALSIKWNCIQAGHDTAS